MNCIYALCDCCRKGCPDIAGHHNNFDWTSASDWKRLFWAIVLMIALMGLVVVIKSLPVLDNFVETYIHNLQTLYAFSLIFAGFILFIIREKARGWYGAIELIFAFFYGYHSITKFLQGGSIEILTVVASIYLVVRGFDNLKQSDTDAKRREAMQKEIDETRRLKEDDELLYEIMPYYHR